MVDSFTLKLVIVITIKVEVHDQQVLYCTSLFPTYQTKKTTDRYKGEIYGYFVNSTLAHLLLQITLAHLLLKINVSSTRARKVPTNSLDR